jgi:hypothetical protein
MKSQKAGTTPPWALELIKHEDDIEACARVLLGPFHAKYRDRIKKVFLYAFHQGWTAGWRAAKGLKASPKKRGRPGGINEDLKALLFKDIEERPPKRTVEEAVKACLTALRMGQCYAAWRKSHDRLRLADPPPEPPEHVWREAEAMVTSEDVQKWSRAYYRYLDGVKRRSSKGETA